MECNICGNDNFSTEEKLIQCSVCLAYYDLAVETKGKSKKKRVRDRKRKRDSTNSDPLEQIETESKVIEWTTHDAFNIILRKQVDCLIKLGVNHKLHDVVLQLWARYLHLISVAFPDRDPDTDVYFNVPRNRDFSFANSKKYELKHRRVSMVLGKPHSNSVAPLPEKHKETKRKVIKKPKKKLVEGDSSDGDDDDVALLFLQMEKLKQKLNEESDSDPDSKSQGMIYEKKLINARSLMKSQPQRVSSFASKQVDCMNMIKTVSFCYLGILIIEDSILLSDIIRWIREGHFPYLEGMNLLPSYMNLHHSDCKTFSRTKPPSCYDVRQSAGKLAHFLGLQDFPRPSLNALVSRFVMDLNLPTELISYVKGLMDIKCMNMFWGKTTARRQLSYFEDPSNISIPDYEGRMMALIVVALKLLFGLDDHTERKISSYAHKQSILYQSEKRPFIWGEWVDQLNMKMNFSNAYCAPYGISEYGDGVIDVSSMHQFFRQTMLKRQQPTTSNRKDYGKDVIYPLYALFAHLNNSDATFTKDQNQPTSFPLRHVTQLFCSRSGNKNFHLRDFHNSTLLYLTEPRTWNYVHKNNRINEDLALSIEDGSEDFLQNSDYWFYDAKSHDLNSSSLEVLPQSFQWLLNMLCRPIELKPTELYAKVLLIEKIVLNCGKLTKQGRLSIEKVIW